MLGLGIIGVVLLGVVVEVEVEVVKGWILDRIEGLIRLRRSIVWKRVYVSWGC